MMRRAFLALGGLAAGVGPAAAQRPAQTATPRGPVTPQMFGARGDLTADDAPAFEAAIARQQALGGGEVRIPAGGYRLTRQLVLPYQVSLVGEGLASSTLRFDGPTDGIVVQDRFNLGQRIEGLNLKSNHPGCLSAIRVPRSQQGCVNLIVKDVMVNSTEPERNRWQTGLFAENLQNSRVEGLLIYYAAAIGLRLSYGCNANTFVGCEVVGLTSRSRLGVRQDATAAGNVEVITFEDFWYGLTLQGHFEECAWRVASCSPKVHGAHIENTNPRPLEGADIVLSGGVVNASFVGMEGGSLKAQGTIRNLALSHGQMGDIELGENCWAVLSGLRYGALRAHPTALVTSIGCSTTNGVQRPNPTLDTVSYASVVPRITGNQDLPAIPQSEVVIFANTAPTRVRGLRGGLEGQRLFCLVGTNTVLTRGGNLRLAGELVGGPNVTVSLIMLEGTWYELSRSAN